MKIGLHVPSWPPGRISNGIVTYASYLVPALRRLGHTVFILTGNKPAEDRNPYTINTNELAPALSLWDRVLYRLNPTAAAFKAASAPIARAVRDLVAKHELDVVEIEESGGWSLAVSRLQTVPVVVRLHGPWFLTAKFDDPGDEIPLFRRREKLEGLGIRNANFITSSCEQTLNAVQDYYRLELKNSRVIRIPIETGAETTVWDPNACVADTILFIGRFDKLKGGDLVLKAFSELAAINQKLR